MGLPGRIQPAVSVRTSLHDRGMPCSFISRLDEN